MVDPTEFGMTGATTTGRFLVLLPDDDHEAGVAALKKHTGVQVASASELSAEQIATEKGVVFDTLGVAVVEAAPQDIQAAAVAVAPGGPSNVPALEPERVVYALESEVYAPPASLLPSGAENGGGLSSEYLRGFRDAAIQLAAAAGVGGEAAAGVSAEAFDETQLTWGLQATGAARSRLTGAGIKVAVLDTGFDATHLDFLGRNIVSQSFVAGETVADVVGHGTH